MDLADKAQDYTEQRLNAAIQTITNRRNQPVSDGFCIDCDEEIDVARLRALPSAQRCIDCQTTHEIKQRK